MKRNGRRATEVLCASALFEFESQILRKAQITSRAVSERIEYVECRAFL